MLLFDKGLGSVESAVMSVANPSRGFLSIDLELPSGSGGLLQVYDLGGRIVAERAVAVAVWAVPGSQLPTTSV